MTLIDAGRRKSADPVSHDPTEADALIEEARQRQRKRRLLVVSIVLVVVVAAGVWVASGGISGTKPPSSANKPGHIKTPSGAPGSATPSGRLKARTSPVYQVVVSADGRTVTAWGGVSCGHPQSLRARSYPNRVTLTWVTPVVPPSTLCLLDLAAETVSTRLPAPLGKRRLVQASSGKPIPSFDASRFARFTVLPPGCHLEGDAPAGEPHNPGDTRDCFYRGSGSTGVPLTVTQFTGIVAPGLGPAWPVVGHPSIHGHKATLQVGAESGQGATTPVEGRSPISAPPTEPGAVYARAVTWHADGYTFVVLSLQNDGRQRVLSTRQLLAIADGLRP
jgi:hypothetical protein